MDTPQSAKRLTIAMVNDAVTDCIAGSFISTRRFAELLSARGHKIIFIAARSPEHPTNDLYNNCPVYRFRSMLLPKSEGQLYLGFPRTAELKKIFLDEHVDVVHIMIPTFTAMAAIRAAKELKIPLVMHSHTQPENLFLHLPSFLPIKTINTLFYRYLNSLFRDASAVVFPTKFSQQQFKNLPQVRQEVISNGVNTSVFYTQDASSFIEKFKIDKTKKQVLYLGRLHPEKSVDTFIRAIPHILKDAPQTHFVVGGFGHLSNTLQKLAEELGVKDAVTFTGKLSDQEVALAYNACDIYVLPSYAELEGMTVLEAMACGRPILIANSKDSAATYFVENNGFLFNAGDAQDLASKALQLLTSETLLRQSSDQSLAVSHRYKIESSVDQLESVYDSLVTTA